MEVGKFCKRGPPRRRYYELTAIGASKHYPFLVRLRPGGQPSGRLSRTRPGSAGPAGVREFECDSAGGGHWGEAPHPTLTGIGVTWLYGFDFEIKVIARQPERK